MKIKDFEQINGLLKALRSVQELIRRIEQAELGDFELFIERNGSIKLSEDGGDSTHYQGYAVSRGFRESLKRLALKELTARRQEVERELVALGVDTSE